MSSTLMLVDDHNPSYITTRKIRLRDRLAAHRRSLTLDRALAGGASPDSDAALALRAQALIGQPAGVSWQTRYAESSRMRIGRQAPGVQWLSPTASSGPSSQTYRGWPSDFSQRNPSTCEARPA